MWNKVKNWWNKDKLELEYYLRTAKERLDVTLTSLDAKRAEVDYLNGVIKQHENALASADNALELLQAQHDELKKEHPDMKAEGVLTPWFVVGVSGENELKGLKIFMDWNDAVIQHMKDKNLGYKTDEEMIQHFIAQLYEHVLMVLERKIIDDSDLDRKNEFE